MTFAHESWARTFLTFGNSSPYEDYDGKFSSLEELDNLLERTVSYLVSIEAYTGTENLAKTSISVSETLNGLEHLNTTKSLSNLAQYYLSVGKYDEAGKLYQQARRQRTRHVFE